MQHLIHISHEMKLLHVHKTSTTTKQSDTMKNVINNEIINVYRWLQAGITRVNNQAKKGTLT